MKIKALAIIFAAFALLPLPASASLLYILNTNGCSPSSCGSGPFGAVLLTQGAADTVHVKVTLNSPYEFVSTGAGDALAFSIFGNPAIDIANLTTDFARDLSSPPLHASAFDYFEYGVVWTGGPGGSDPSLGPLEFDVTDHLGNALTPEDFIASVDHSGNPTQYYFAADIGALGAGGNGNTGNVGATGTACDPDAGECSSYCVDNPDACTIENVPEPATLVLFGAGLFGLGAIRRRRKKT